MRPLIGTGLKMNQSSSEAATYFDELRPLVAPLTSCELFVLPPFTSLWVARDRLRNSNISWGAQDVHAEDAGAHTGDISAPMLVDLGCSFVEVGHSERRRDHGETDEAVALKVRQVLRYDMTPIMCVGEQIAGSPEVALDHVIRQARTGMSLALAADRRRVVIAYEPIWAIGTGRNAEPNDAGAVVSLIRSTVGEAFGPDAAQALRVQYGGSVKPGNIRDFMAHPEIDGALVGGASLDPEEFALIVRYR